MYVDVHTHLIHPQFKGEEDEAAARAAEAGLRCVIVNGLRPESNRAVLELCERYDHLFPAIGVYPVDAGVSAIDDDNWTADFAAPAPFDVDAEIDWIEDNLDRVIAIGECGLDAYWVDDEGVRAEQERVLSRLCELSVKYDKPLILHTRKAEQRTFDIIRDLGVTRADFHCYGGKHKLAKRIADHGYYFSIPPIVERDQAFQSLVTKLPAELILTETDAPYMGPDRGARNEPANVPRGVAAIAEARGEDIDTMAETIMNNCQRLFGEF
jgi:TatD DNase family protein